MSRTEKRPASARGSGKGRRSAEDAERSFSGLATHPGIAIGPAAFADEAPAPIPSRSVEPDAVPDELRRVEDAVRRSLRQLEKLKARLAFLSEQSQAEIEPLLDAYRQMLGPSRLLRAVTRRIGEERLGAEAAVSAETERLARALVELVPAGLDADAEEGRAALRRAEEVREIGRRLIRNLSRAPFRSFGAVPAGAVLVTEQLRPADAALLDPSRIAGVVMEDGGAADHTAIMLRALGIPSVMGVAEIAATVTPGTVLVVDGSAGTVVVRPAAATLEKARSASTSFARQQQKLARLRHLPAQLTGGEAVELQANLELPAELGQIAQSGAAGIGLLRTEFLFINADTLPREDEQEAVYRGIVEAMAGDCTTIRLLDWGGEKQSEAMA
ncbi:MAG: phosphoenolpyruvate--protein phosphotransferase, partial [Gluconacetobacter diazotrophicus]|nr:phosphoenolpyruvate--protein phosphotransferase [Gluconacetobacter diazotrophicus]